MASETPHQSPPAADEARAELHQALHDPGLRRAIRVRLAISGGLPEERYELRFLAHGGKVDCSLTRAKNLGMKYAKSSDLSDRELDELFQRMNLSQLLKADLPRPRMPPDSLVGRLELSAGQSPMTVYFMADPGQAEDAGFEPPPALARSIDAIYGICGRILGVKRVAP